MLAKVLIVSLVAVVGSSLGSPTDCTPSDSFTTILVCDNSQNVADIECSFIRRVGIYPNSVR